MQLIDREALLKSLSYVQINDISQIVTMHKIAIAPTIDAVPLYKLCDWLAKKAVFFANDNDSDPEAWKETIKEHVMEGTNADKT